MNLFRSEEDARRWAQFDPAWTANLRPVSAWIERFAAEMFRGPEPPELHHVVDGVAGAPGPVTAGRRTTRLP